MSWVTSPAVGYCRSTWQDNIFFDIENWNRNSGPVLTYPNIFLNPQRFLSGYGYRPHVSGVSGRQIRNVLNPRIRVDGQIQFESGKKTLRIRKYPDTRRWGLSPADRPLLGPVHTYPDIFESATFSSQLPVHTYLRIRLPDTPDTCGR